MYLVGLCLKPIQNGSKNQRQSGRQVSQNLTTENLAYA
jgi:hypothetical protein